jgi:hypothetical protein
MKCFGAFLIFFVARQAETKVSGGRCGWTLCLVERGALGTARNFRTRFRAPAAGAPPPGSPPRWAPVGPSAVVSAAHEPGWVGYRLWGVGAAFWCPKWPVPLSRLFGGGLESHRNPLKSVGSASGWCGVGHRHLPATFTRGYPRKRPGSTPNPKSGSEIGRVKASTRLICGAVRRPLHIYEGSLGRIGNTAPSSSDDIPMGSKRFALHGIEYTRFSSSKSYFGVGDLCETKIHLLGPKKTIYSNTPNPPHAPPGVLEGGATKGGARARGFRNSQGASKPVFGALCCERTAATAVHHPIARA